jgi:hypothetical protein
MDEVKDMRGSLLHIAKMEKARMPARLSPISAFSCETRVPGKTAMD